MKQAIISATLGLIILILIYGLAVFVSWEPNPKLWDVPGRVVYGFLNVIWIAIIGYKISEEL